MKKTMKKITALMSAALFTAVLAVPTFSTAAAGDPWVEDSAQNPLMDLTNDPYFNKTLTIYNDLEVNAYIPGVTYTYAVTSAAPGENAIVTDKNGLQATVQAGPEGGLTVDSPFNFDNIGSAVELTIPAGASVASATITGEVGVTYDATQFDAAGVYRYLITETSSDYTSYGITRAEASATRYVDVYVRETDTAGEFEVYGAVMFYDIAATDSVTVSTVKTDGFTNNGDPTGEISDTTFTPDETLATDPTTYTDDKLYTYNYTVEKEIEKSMIGGETFPFTVTVSNTGSAQYFNYSTAAAASSTAALTAATEKGTVNTADTAVSLGDGKFLALTALPANVSVSVSEQNTQNAVYDVTAVDATAAGITLSDTSISKNESSAFESALALTNYASNTIAEPTAALTATTFTNEMQPISVTGVLFMAAPFVLMIAAAGLFIFIIVRSRKRESTDNVI